MATVPTGRVRRAIAVCLLASLVPGLAAPIVSARGQGRSALYAEWLADRMAERLDDRVSDAFSRIGPDRHVSLDAWLDALVGDLVATYGLESSSRMLGVEPTASADQLAALLLDGLHSLSPGDLPVATLLTGPDGRSTLVARSSGAVVSAENLHVGPIPADSCVPATDTPAIGTCRPATGGAQPLGP